MLNCEHQTVKNWKETGTMSSKLALVSFPMTFGSYQNWLDVVQWLETTFRKALSKTTR